MGCAGVAGMRVWTPQDGNTALIWAARNGQVEAVALLLDRGADLEAKNKVSSSAAPPACRPAGVVRGRDAGSCSAERGRPAARAAGPGARTGERRVGCGCGA
ncbi:MAG: ankyrin repeat domain-containing protein [Chloroflexi bacterium]|nr:ankyrin repeat domain-containing protein [Chloroflexota bacterium]